MKLCLLAIGDGRDEVHERSWASAKEHIGATEHVVKVDDSSHDLGFAGAIQRGWDDVSATDADYVVHIELDFLFFARVPLERIVAVLQRHPYLAQICLKRQPWNDQEKAAGGIVESNPLDYRQRVEHGDIWTEHRRFFSTNPSVYPAALCRQGWPQDLQSEGVFTHRLLEDPDVRFAFWGAKHDPPLVEHIGAVRAGTGY